MSREPCTNQDGTGKRTYPSRAAAERAARRTNHERHNDAPVVAYLCPAGGHFHAGHPFEEDLRR